MRLFSNLFCRSGTNDALQASLDKVQDIKDKVEGNLRKEQLVDQKAKEEIAQKSNKIKSLLNDVENSKQATQNCRDELVSAYKYPGGQCVCAYDDMINDY